MVMVGEEEGLYTTRDGGIVWTHISAGGNSCYALAFDEHNPDIVYASSLSDLGYFP
jgi:hypothetical protein